MSIMLEPEFKNCPLCGDGLVKKYNTNEKTVITLKGKLVCWERVLKCRNKDCKGNLMSFHSSEYKSLALSSMNFGTDVLALEGGLRFSEHKTIDEVLDKLSFYGIHTNRATVSKHSDKYLALISGYHKENKRQFWKTTCCSQ